MKTVREILDELEPETLAAKERVIDMKDQLEQLVRQMHSTGILYSESIREFKKRFILNVLRECRGNQCKAARELGMHRNTLSRTIAELGMHEEIRQLTARSGRYAQRKASTGVSSSKQAAFSSQHSA